MFPVNKASHWTLLVINTERQELYLYNSMPQNMWSFEHEFNLGVQIGDGLLPERTLQWKMVDP